MSQFSDNNSAFIRTIKELPKFISMIGYEPLDPRLINSRSGIFVALMAMLRLPDVHINNDILIFVTAKIGKELLLDPYELLTPADYRIASGTRKLEY